MATIDEVLEFWFDDVAGEDGELPKWFRKSAQFDAEIEERFGRAIEAARAGELDDWAQDARGALALVVLLDQFTRNACRGTPAAFSGDEKALSVTRRAIARGFDQELPTPERGFLYMPLEHAEDGEAQAESVSAFQGLVATAPEEHRDLAQMFLRYAKLHKVVIDRFGRYPHRNEILGRETTAEEAEFLQQPNSSF